MRFAKRQLAVSYDEGSVSILETASDVPGSVCITAYAKGRLPQGAVENGRILKPKHVKSVIGDLLIAPEFGEFRGNRATVVVPESLCTHHVNRFTHKYGTFDPSSIKVHVQSARNPFDEEHDVCPLNHWQDGETVTLSMHGKSKQAMQRLSELLEELGVKAEKFVSFVHASLQYYFSSKTVAEPVLFLHFGQHQIQLAAVDAHGVYESEYLPFGVEDLMHALRRELALAPDVLSLLLFEHGLRKTKTKKAAQLRDALLSEVSHLHQSASQMRDFYRHVGGLDREHPALFLCGSGSLIPGMAEYLSDELGLTSRVPDSWLEIEPKFSLHKHEELSHLIGSTL